MSIGLISGFSEPPCGGSSRDAPSPFRRSKAGWPNANSAGVTEESANSEESATISLSFPNTSQHFPKESPETR